MQMRTNWDMMVSGKELAAEKNNRKKVFISEKIAVQDLPTYIDHGWEKSKDYKNPKHVGVI